MLAAAAIGGYLWIAERAPADAATPPSRTEDSPTPRSASTPAPQVVDEPCPHPFVPVGRGSTWRYALRVPGAEEMEAVLTATSALREGDTWTIDYQGTTVRATERYQRRCTADTADEPWGLAAAIGFRQVEAPWQTRARYLIDFEEDTVIEVQFPTLSAGEPTWRRIPRHRRVHVAGRERVDVPAGSFDALHLTTEEDTRPGAPAAIMEQWLAEGVGLVRMTTRASPTSELAAEQVLVEFTGPD